MLFDINPNKYKLDKKWGIDKFVSNSVYKTSRGTPANPSSAAEIELLKNLKDIERDYFKHEKEYDQIMREMVLKRNALKKRMDQMEAGNAKYQDIVAIESVDISLIRHQLAAIESKQRLTNDKYRSLRDERKSFETKSADDTNKNTQSVIVANSPLSVAGMAQTMSTTPQVFTAPSAIAQAPAAPVIEYKSKDLEDLNKKEKEVALEYVEAPVTETPDTNMGKLKTLIKEKAKVDASATSVDLLGQPLETLTDKDIKNINLIEARQANEEKVLNRTNLLGHSYATSLDNLESETTPHKTVLYINPDDGVYYEKAFTTDSDGNYTKELESFHPRSVTHLGSIDIDTRTKQVTTYYDTQPMDFIITRNDNHMPAFYRNEWDDEKNVKYILPEHVRKQLQAIYPNDDI